MDLRSLADPSEHCGSDTPGTRRAATYAGHLTQAAVLAHVFAIRHMAASPFGRVVLAASLGGMDAFNTVLAGLPSAFPVPIVVVQHRPVRSDGHDALVGVLGRRTPLTVQPAQAGGTALRPGVTVVPGGTTATIDTDGRWILEPSNREQWPGDAVLMSS